VLVGATLLAGSRPVSAFEIMELPATLLILDRPGHYDVTCDLTSTGSGIAITADDVVLDLHGHRLTGPGSTSRRIGEIGTEGVRVEGSGVTIQNGTITGFYSGIHLWASSHNQIVLNTVSDCSVGICVTRGTQNFVWLNRVTPATTAIVVSEGSSNTIALNTVLVDNDGIQVENSTGNTVLSNSVVGSTVPGSVAPQPSASRIGIFLLAAAGNSIRNNTVESFDLGIVLGVDARTTGNMVANNFVRANREVGIYVTQEVMGNTVQSNQVTGDGFADLLDENVFHPGPCLSTWQNNRFATDNETGANFGPGAGCIH
jgi:parallel beta-helix repeat protein